MRADRQLIVSEGTKRTTQRKNAPVILMHSCLLKVDIMANGLYPTTGTGIEDRFLLGTGPNQPNLSTWFAVIFGDSPIDAFQDNDVTLWREAVSTNDNRGAEGETTAGSGTISLILTLTDNGATSAAQHPLLDGLRVGGGVGLLFPHGNQ